MDKELEQDIKKMQDQFQPNRYCEYLHVKSKDISSKKNSLFYLSIFLLNICVIIIYWTIESRKSSIAAFKDVFKDLDWKFLGLILLTLLLILLIRAVIDYYSLRTRTKQRRFGLMLLANIHSSFYNCVSIGKSGGVITLFDHMRNSGVKDVVALELSCGKRFFQKIGMLIMAFVSIVVGSIFFFDKVDLWIVILSSVFLFINCIPILFVLYFEKKKDRILAIIASISKFLYKIRIIKDYELFYKNRVDELHFYSNSLKMHKLSIVLNVISRIVVDFLRYFILYIILLFINFDVSGLFFEVIYKCVLLGVVLSLIPLPGGVVVYELLFMILFRGIFFDGYLLWGLLLFRVFDYFIHYVVFAIIKLLEIVYRKINIKNKA